MYVDECTTKQTQVSFARMLVEVNVTKPLSDKVEVMDPNGIIFQQVVTYDWKPLFCNKCQVIGHVCPKERRKNEAQQVDQAKRQGGLKKTIQIWVTKEQAIEQQRNSNKDAEQNIEQEVPRLKKTSDKHTKGNKQIQKENAVIQKQQSITMPSSNGVRNEDITPNKGKTVNNVSELNLQDFPILSSVSTKNGFEVLNRGYDGSHLAPPDKGGLSDTKVKKHKAHTVTKVVAPNWGFQNNYLSANNGRIWSLCDNSIYIVDKLREEVHLLHCQITIKAIGMPCVLTVIFGYNTCELRRNLLDALKELAQGINMPWLIGDFNAVLYPQDKFFRNPVQYAEIRDFTECIHNLLLNKVNWKGEYYTWTNKQQSNDRTCSRLDKAFGIHEWMMQWGHVVMEYDVPLISDHAPMLFSLEANQNKVNVPFRFFIPGRNMTTFWP
uniref:Uncharacterized protein LOC104215897 n=1 Tax=Nicotiana sylvestris TaxID=4096 RepID=A0A1U7VQG1_NICSY|nr:PREDICTED: uncharacterized protein LOC104215897 [Nicotiana sylvestris]